MGAWVTICLSFVITREERYQAKAGIRVPLTLYLLLSCRFHPSIHPVPGSSYMTVTLPYFDKQ
jgi:hypothetical protein